MRVQAFLLAAVRRRKLRRQRMAGVWVYFSGDPAVGEAQRRARRARLDQQRASEAAATLEATLVIEVLLALIRHPGSSTAQLARRLQGHVPPIGLPQVSAVFKRFELEQVAQKGGSADC